MYEAPEMGKLNGSGGDSANGWLYQVNYVAVASVVLGVAVGVLLVALVQIDTTVVLSTPDEVA